MFIDLDLNRMPLEKLAAIEAVGPELAAEIARRRSERPLRSILELSELGVSEERLTRLHRYGLYAAEPMPPAPRPRPGGREEPGRQPEQGPGCLPGLARLLFPQLTGGEPPRRAPEGVTIPPVFDRRKVEREGWPVYCLKVWILIGRRVRTGSPPREEVVGSSELARRARGDGLVKTPSQRAVNTVAEHVREANEIFDGCGVQFELCNVRVIDTHLLEQQQNTEPLADQIYTFGGDFNADDPNMNPLAELHHAMGRHLGDAYPPDCAHIFYVHDVLSRDEGGGTSDAKGVGTSMERGAGSGRFTPVGAVENRGGRTVAHELIHGMGRPHVEDESFYDAQRDADNVMRKLHQEGSTYDEINEDQCELIRNFLAANLRVGCP